MKFSSFFSQKVVCIIVLFSAVIFSSCKKEDILNDTTLQSVPKTTTAIQIGKKIDSPLLLRNMQRAADSLTYRAQLRSGVSLSATHYYVRFLPADTAEYNRLVADKTLDFTSYPLDYEVSEGDYYHDPSLPAEAITWQYTVVPVSYNLESFNIQYEKLEDLYILDDDLESEELSIGNSSTLRSRISITWKDLVTESAIQTGYISRQTLRSKWTPSATIMAYDDLLNKYIPLQGVKVRIRYFAFMKAYHYTDKNGYVSFSNKNTSVEYSIEWERDMWDIRDGGVQSFYHGPDQKSAWNLKIGTGTPKSLHISAIHRALYKYYYGDVCGLIRPSESLKVNYNSKDTDGPNGSTDYVTLEFFKDILSSIKIYGLDNNGSYKVGSSIFSTMTHELTHASHCFFVGFTDYVKTDILVREALALAGQWVLTQDEYKQINRETNSNYEHLLSFIECQDWPYNKPNKAFNRNIKYSPLMIDMLDEVNQATRSKPLNDQIQGYRLYLFERSMNEIFSVSDFQNLVISLSPSNVSKQSINDYFEQFNSFYK